MRAWAWGATAISALAACGTSGGAAGAGGHPTGSGDPCTSGADCTQCADKASCFACNTTAHGPGVAAYDAFLQCVFCGACYTTCDGAMVPEVCPMPPASPDPCDGTVANTAACFGGTMNCQICASEGSCHGAFSTCDGNPDCKALLLALPKCPAM